VRRVVAADACVCSNLEELMRVVGKSKEGAPIPVE